MRDCCRAGQRAAVLTRGELEELAAIGELSGSMLIAMLAHRTHRNRPISFDTHPYLRAIYLDGSEYMVIKKSTQCGVSEYLMVRVFNSTIKDGRSVFYVLPTFQLASRYVRNRVDRSIANTPEYQRAMSSSRMLTNKSAESMFLKHLGPGSIAFAGSNTSSVFTEYPADELVVDELDECHQENIIMGVERLSASESRRQVKVGNPTVAGFGIDQEFAATDQSEWFIKCEACGHKFHPDFFRNVVEQVGGDEESAAGGDFVVRDPDWDPEGPGDARLICDRCGRPVNRFSDGEWVPRYSSRRRRGYHISKLFSTTTSLSELITDRFEPGLSNPTMMQRFYNADLGLAYRARGASITEEMLDACAGDFSLGFPSRPCVMGVDVGAVLHISCLELVEGGTRLIHAEEAADFDDIARVWRDYRCVAGCIDAQPERRLALKASHSFKGMYMVFQQGDAKRETVDRKRKQVTVDRTAQLDAVYEAFATKAVALPRDVRAVEGFYEQMTAATRVLNRERQVYRWTEGSAPDHWHHSIAFAMTAHKMLVSLGGLR